jgi:hypothetical protein
MMFLFVIGIIIRIVPNIKIILTGTGRNIRDLFLCEQQQTIYIYIYIVNHIYTISFKATTDLTGKNKVQGNYFLEKKKT